MDLKVELLQQISFLLNLKKKKSSKKKGSKKRSGKKKSSKKRTVTRVVNRPRTQVVNRPRTQVVNRPVFYNTYDPLTDYLSAARLGSSFNNLTNISSAPTGNRDYLTQNYQDSLTSSRDAASRSAVENMSNRNVYDNPIVPGAPTYSSGIGADFSFDTTVETNYQAMGINTRGERLDAELEGQVISRQRAEQATAHSAQLDGAVYGPAFLQPDFGGQDMIGNPSLDDMFHQEEIMMNGGGLGAAAAHRAAVRKVKDDRERRKREQQRKVQKKTTSIIPYSQPIPQPPQPEPYGRSRPSRRRPAAQPVSMVGGFDF